MQPNQTPNPQPTNPAAPQPTPPPAPPPALNQPTVVPPTNPAGHAPVAPSVQNTPVPQPVTPNTLPNANPAPLPGATPPTPSPSTPPSPMMSTNAPQAPAPLGATPAPLPTPVPAPSAPSFQTVASTPSPATYGVPAPTMATTVPMGANTAFGASGNEAGMMVKGKTKIGLIIGLLVGLAVVVVIGLMVWLNWDHLAIMFDPKFAYYTIDNGDQGKYEIKFYKGATIKKGSELEYLKSLNSSDGLIVDKLKSANWLYLKPSDSSKAPLILLAGKANSSDTASSSNCIAPDESDTVVSTVDASKNTVCYQMVKDNLTDKTSVTMIGAMMRFTQKNSLGGVFITNDVDNIGGANDILSKAKSSGSISETQQVVDDLYKKYDLATRKDGIKTILASIRILGEPKK